MGTLDEIGHRLHDLVPFPLDLDWHKRLAIDAVNLLACSQIDENARRVRRCNPIRNTLTHATAIETMLRETRAE